ncbi:hypothetical protein OH809_03330 [Streptomyces sp. NBC_00873]|uniref:hypothetical protein n=1 Tax=unclassified Streptomyces TaxID=2593676 RepID=UPI003864B4A4|nr:hypothetical protein OH809_03330 [Streptomyces sp. NBC_00873]WTA48090.1 hypothetical protein OH821_40465 [Streptomyces sp. NBC_00842]
MIGAYTVRSPGSDHSSATPSWIQPHQLQETSPYQLRVTTLGMQLWERAVLLWSHPRPELRVIPDGSKLRVHHEGREISVMQLNQPGAAQEVQFTARRYGTA